MAASQQRPTRPPTRDACFANSISTSPSHKLLAAITLQSNTSTLARLARTRMTKRRASMRTTRRLRALRSQARLPTATWHKPRFKRRVPQTPTVATEYQRTRRFIHSSPTRWTTETKRIAGILICPPAPARRARQMHNRIARQARPHRRVTAHAVQAHAAFYLALHHQLGQPRRKLSPILPTDQLS
jgi:hypothetical protein